MNFKKEIKTIVTRFPKLSLAGYHFLKKAWSVKANFTNYEYPENIGDASFPLKTIIDYNKNRDFGPKKRICYAPFNNMHFKIDGEISACSFNKVTRIGNINEDTIHNIWFGETAQKLRDSLGNYNFENCYGCKLVLASGNYRSFPANKYDYHSSDETKYPTQMSFETSNICNLECLMCDEELSSAIRKNKAKLPALKDVYPSDFMEQLKEFIPHLSIATFIGGEPLLIKRYYEIWQTIIETNPSCNIHLQTNATYLPEKFISLLDSGQFDIGISMEGCTKETYEKIRVRGNFETVEQNIRKLVALKDEGKVYLNFNFCPLTLNWQEVPLMVIYVNQFNAALKLLNVETPRNLSLKFQSSAFLKEVHEYLINYPFKNEEDNFFTARNKETYNYFIKTVESYIEEAKNREAYFTAQSNTSISELEKIIIDDFVNGNVLSYVSKEDRISYAETINRLIREKSENIAIQHRTLMRFAYFFKEVMNENDTFKIISKSVAQLQREATEFLELEKETYKKNESVTLEVSN